MPAVKSTMIPLGIKAPQFTLRNHDGKLYTWQHCKGKTGTLVMFICNHCPFVIHVRKKLVHLYNDFYKLGIHFISINSNDIEKYPQDSPEQMHREALEHNYIFPYLFDKTQSIAKAYQAACTPEFFVFNGDELLVYHGQLDDSRPNNNIPVTGDNIKTVFSLLLKGEGKIKKEQKPSIGCSIKWKQGNIPSYFRNDL